MEASELNLTDGTYVVDVTMEGGSGRASIQSPTEMTVENGQVQAEIVWSSSHYDYMLVGDEKFLPVNTEGNSVFEIPVSVFDAPMSVIGDTTAMSVPHEVTYTLTFDSDSIATADNIGEHCVSVEGVGIALALVVACISAVTVGIRKRKRKIG